MESKTISILLPNIKLSFDPYILDPLYGMLRIVHDKIVPHAYKKIRSQDVDKSKEFKNLFNDFLETYERKKIEKAEYNEKVKNSSKRSCLPVTGSTAKFKRF